jgi:hypothetical protein
MLNWRDIGLRRGEQGDEFSPSTLRCPYCGARGHFNRVFRGKARGSEGEGELYSDVWQCLECANFTFVIWRPSQGFFNYRAYPYERAYTLSHPSWPQAAAHGYEEAVGALLSEDWESAIIMAKHAIGAATADANPPPTEESLQEALRQLARQGHITRALAAWAASIPALAATPKSPEARQAREVVRLSRYLLEQLYSLPFDAKRHHTPPTAQT